MRLHSISSTHARPKSRRVGRGNGSAHGTYAGRGVKGQKARTGANSNIPRTFIGGSTSLVQSLPKLKGFKSRATKPQTINSAMLTKHFAADETVTLIALMEKGIISSSEALRGVKIVGSSAKASHKLTFEEGNARLAISKQLLAS